MNDTILPSVPAPEAAPASSFVPEAYIYSGGGWMSEGPYYVPVRIVKKGKATITVVNSRGETFTFNLPKEVERNEVTRHYDRVVREIRPDDRLEERGAYSGDRYSRSYRYLLFDLAKCEEGAKVLNHRRALKRRQRAAIEGLTEMIGQLRNQELEEPSIIGLEKALAIVKVKQNKEDVPAVEGVAGAAPVGA